MGRNDEVPSPNITEDHESADMASLKDAQPVAVQAFAGLTPSYWG